MIDAIKPDRSKIVLDHECGIKHWIRPFGVTKQELARATEKVRNSAAAVRKELAAVKSASQPN
jgi:hypothetical protein